MNSAPGIDTKITLLAAGLIFLLALVLGVWKYRQIMAAEDHRAHPYVDIAHRAALLYSFATLLIAVFVELSAWPAWVNLTAAMVVVFFFVAAIASYISHGARRDTTNQFENADRVHRRATVVTEQAHWSHGSGNRAAADRLLQGPEPSRPETGDGLSQSRRHYRKP